MYTATDKPILNLKEPMRVVLSIPDTATDKLCSSATINIKYDDIRLLSQNKTNPRFGEFPSG